MPSRVNRTGHLSPPNNGKALKGYLSKATELFVGLFIFAIFRQSLKLTINVSDCESCTHFK